MTMTMTMSPKSRGTAAPRPAYRTALRYVFAVASATAFLAGCSGRGPFLPSSGPPAEHVVPSDPGSSTSSRIVVQDVTADLARRSVHARRATALASLPGATQVPRLVLGIGDTLEVSIWEAPPATLFGAATIESRGLAATTSRVAVLPEQVIDADGTIAVPFAGPLRAAGRSAAELEADIARRLRGKANDPQVVVRPLRTPSASVTVVGEVAGNARVPLSPRGDRLLDALAMAGGSRQPVGKLTVQLTREATEEGRRVARTASMPLESIIADPAQNVLLQPGDIVTVLHLPHSFTVMGAVARNEEISFEAQGISLAQALARAGGLRDERANARAVFIFRLEDPAVLAANGPLPVTVDGTVPVVYRLDLRDPVSVFAAQDFPIRNKDTLYVANAPAAELQKFLGLLSAATVPFLQFRALGD